MILKIIKNSTYRCLNEKDTNLTLNQTATRFLLKNKIIFFFKLFFRFSNFSLITLKKIQNHLGQFLSNLMPLVNYLVSPTNQQEWLDEVQIIPRPIIVLSVFQRTLYSRGLSRSANKMLTLHKYRRREIKHLNPRAKCRY